MSVRVLHVVSYLGHRGSEQQVVFLAQGLPRDEFDVHVCALGCCPSQRAALEQTGVPVALLGGSAIPAATQLTEPLGTGSVNDHWQSMRSWRFPNCFWRLADHIWRLSPDVVHVWSDAQRACEKRYARWAALLANSGRARGFRLVVSQWRRDSPPAGTQGTRGASGKTRGSISERILDRRTARITYPCLAHASAVGPAIGMPQQGTPQSISMPLGIRGMSTPSWSQRHELLRENGLPAETKLMVAYSDYSADSHFKDAIWTADLLKVIRDDTHLVMIGDGPLRWRGERFRDQVEIADRVHLVTDCCAWNRWLPYADCYWDVDGQQHTMPFTAAAMSNGIPVISADTEASRDLLGDDGAMYFSVGHRGGLARHCQELLECDELAARLGARVRDRAKKFLSVEEMLQRHADLYRELAA